MQLAGRKHSKHWEQQEQKTLFQGRKRLQLFEEQKADKCDWSIVSKREND